MKIAKWERKRIAYHEAGHVVIAVVFGGKASATIEPPLTKSETIWPARYMGDMGGLAAELLRFPRTVSRGSGADARKVPVHLQSKMLIGAMEVLRAWWCFVMRVAKQIERKGEIGRRDVERHYRQTRRSCVCTPGRPRCIIE